VLGLGGFGIPEVFILGMLSGIVLAIVGGVIMIVRLLRTQKRRAVEFGYPSLGAYLRAAPQTDEEKKEAADLALKGLVMCLLGLIFPPLLLVGLFPAFYGVRKLLYASMGLGLVDDPQRPHTGA